MSISQVRAMSLDELKSWQQYDEAEFLPDRRNEIQLAQIAYILSCSNSRNPSRYKLQDFMPSQDNAPQSPDEFLRRLRNG